MARGRCRDAFVVLSFLVFVPRQISQQLISKLRRLFLTSSLTETVEIF